MTFVHRASVLVRAYLVTAGSEYPDASGGYLTHISNETAGGLSGGVSSLRKRLRTKAVRLNLICQSQPRENAWDDDGLILHV